MYRTIKETASARHCRALALLLLCSLLSGCSEKPLRLGVHAWIGFDVIAMAQQLGWVAPQIELIETDSGADALTALASGDLHAACLTLDEAIRALDRGIPLSVIVVMDVSSGSDSLLTRPGIASVAALAGRRIALDTSSVSMLLLTAALESADLGPADVELVDAAPHRHLELWRSGEIDAVATYEPFARALRAAGARTLLSSRDTPELIFDVIAVRKDAIAGRQQTLKALVDAVLRAQAHVHDNPVDAVYRLASLHDRPITVTEEDLRGVVIPARDVQDAYFDRGSRLRDAVRRINSLFLGAGLLSRPQDASSLLDARFLPEPAS